MSSVNRFASRLFQLSSANTCQGNYSLFLRQTAKMSSQALDPSKLKVEHCIERNEFYIQLKEGKDDDSKAYLLYSYIKPDYVDLEHTVVPHEFRGHGIAKILAQTVFDHFADQRIFMKPTCTYLQKFYKENQLPKYKEMILLGDIKL